MLNISQCETTGISKIKQLKPPWRMLDENHMSSTHLLSDEHGGASSASPRIWSQVVPLQYVQLALVRPSLTAMDVTGTYWIL
jgi:hypothetical protein